MGDAAMADSEYPVGKIRIISERCLSGEPIGDDLACWLGSSLKRFLDRDSATIEEALGLKYARGGVPWWLEEAIRKRDAALRDLAAEHLSHLSAGEKAKVVNRMAIRYAAAGWRFDKQRTCPPRQYAGTEKEYLWIAFKSGATMPIGERQLRNILI